MFVVNFDLESEKKKIIEEEEKCIYRPSRYWSSLEFSFSFSFYGVDYIFDLILILLVR